MIECATAAAYDRPTVLDRADGQALLDAIDSRADMVDRHKSSQRHGPGDRGDTTYLCTVDGDGMGVSLIQSNASGLGSWIAEPNTGINLHNRGSASRSRPDTRPKFAPGRRPPHTLAPALASPRRRSRLGPERWAVTPSRRSCSRSWRAFPPRRKPESGDRRRTLGAERPVDRLRHMDLRRRADRRGRGPRPGAVAGRSRPTRTHRRARPRLRQRIRPPCAIVVEADGVLAGMADPRSRRQVRRDLIAVVSPSAPVGRRASGRAGRRRL